MLDYSIEAACERIYDPRTQEHVREVYGCYVNGFYRAALVVLWTSVVCDLMYKLEELDNGAARTALGTVPKDGAHGSGAWERAFVTEVRERTELLSSVELNALLQLQDLRHTVAHPARQNDDVLHAPSRDVVRAHFRTALDAVFLRSPHYCKKMIVPLLVDLATRSAALQDDGPLASFINVRYERHLSSAARSKLLRDLWKIAYVDASPDARTNREINGRAFGILFDRAPSAFIDNLKTEVDYYARAADGPLDAHEALARLVVRRPTIWRALDPACTYLVQAKRCESPVLDVLLWFKHASLGAHLDTMSGKTDSPFHLVATLESGAAGEADRAAIWRWCARKYLDCATGEGYARWLKWVGPTLERWPPTGIQWFVDELQDSDPIFSIGRPVFDILDKAHFKKTGQNMRPRSTAKRKALGLDIS